METVFSRNKTSETVYWVGSSHLKPFEEVVFIDDVLNLSPLENYEEAIENFWPLFIQDETLN